MKLEEIKKVVKEVDLVTLRCDSDELFEAVRDLGQVAQASSAEFSSDVAEVK